MLIAIPVALLLVAPATAGSTRHSDRVEIGPLHFDWSSALTWPGLYLPSFTLVSDRRQVYRLTLGFEFPALRGLSFDTVVVEPSGDPDIRARTAHLPTEEGSRAYAWTGARLQIPNSRLQLGIGRSLVLGAASAAGRSMIGPSGGWRVDLLRTRR